MSTGEDQGLAIFGYCTDFDTYVEVNIPIKTVIEAWQDMP